MTRVPLVSVGIPTYNRAEGLRRALLSVVNQTYREIEVIVSDNCSENPSVREVTQHFVATDTRVKLYRQEQNIGALRNFGFVLQKATGTYFMWLADDDWLDPDYIRICVEYLSTNPTTLAACCPVRLINAKGNIERDERLADIIDSNPKKRVLDYYKSVSHNSYYYSVFAERAFPLLEVKNEIAHDWVVVARVAFSGEIKVLAGAQMYRSTAGVSSSLSTMAASLQFSLFAQAFPFLAAAFNAGRDICLNPNAYLGLSFFGRLRLAFQTFSIVKKRQKGLKKSLKNAIEFVRLCYRRVIPSIHS